MFALASLMVQYFGFHRAFSSYTMSFTLAWHCFVYGDLACHLIVFVGMCSTVFGATFSRRDYLWTLRAYATWGARWFIPWTLILVCTMENEMRARFRVICEPSESSLTVRHILVRRCVSY